MQLTPTKFLRRVWNAHPSSGTTYAFLAHKNPDTQWEDIHLKWPGPLSLPNPLEDVYFAPCLFSTRHRRKDSALPGCWLYADLDEVDPKSITDLPPTAAWETSRGRYQALWKLSPGLPPDQLARLNQRLTYHTSADKGGWSTTKVLRLPGSVSTKHGYEWRVRLMWFTLQVYDPRQILDVVRNTRTPPTTPEDIPDLVLPKASPSRILRRRKVPAKTRKLCKATPEQAARNDRSARLWKLEAQLLEAGCTPEETLVVVRNTVWNKYKDQRREIPQLWTEINKAASSMRSASSSTPRRKAAAKRASSQRAKSSTSTKSRAASSSRSASRGKKSGRRSRTTSTERQSPSAEPLLPSTGYNKFLGKKLRRPRWLVEGIWSEEAHGVLAGEAKSYKSVIATDLAISVASGTPFLGHFTIPQVGPVIMIQEENNEGETQDRLRRIAYSRGLLGSVELNGNELSVSPDTELDIHLANNIRFNLTDKDHLTRLINTIRKTGAKLVILDPFYLMTPGVDENSAHQVSPILRNLLKIKQTYDCGILLIHHYKKQNVMAPIYGAARMSGTGVFHRWFESAVYVEKDNPDKNPFMVRLQPDHRGHAPTGVIRCTFDLGTDEDLYYGVQVDHTRSAAAQQYTRLRKLVKEKEEWQLDELRVAMGISSTKKLKEMVLGAGFSIEKRKTGRRGRPAYIVSQHPLKT